MTVLTDITELQDLYRQREAYLHVVTHDLRNPLSVILGHAELLERAFERGSLDDSKRHHIEAIIKAGRRISAMLSELIDTARLESGQLRLHREPVDLGAFVSDVKSQVVGRWTEAESKRSWERTCSRSTLTQTI